MSWLKGRWVLRAYVGIMLIGLGWLLVVAVLG